jgi:hypothetical protein
MKKGLKLKLIYHTFYSASLYLWQSKHPPIGHTPLDTYLHVCKLALVMNLWLKYCSMRSLYRGAMISIGFQISTKYACLDWSLTSLCSYSVILRASRGSNNYQFCSFWFDPILDQIHDLPHSRRVRLPLSYRGLNNEQFWFTCQFSVFH